MKMNFPLTLLLCCGMVINGQTVSKDKFLHLGAGLLIGGVGGYSAHKIFGGNRYWTWTGAIGSSLAAGVLKENIDQNEYGGWDNNDIIFTVLGGAVSGLALDLLLKGRGRMRGGKVISSYDIHFDFSTSNKTKILLNFSENGSHDLAAFLQAQIIIAEGVEL